MTTTDASDGRVAQTDQPIAAWLVSPLRAPARLWLRGALLLAGAAQLITISALASADPDPATWAMLLLAVAPALLAGAAVFAPSAPVKLGAVVVAGAAMVVGLAGAATYTGFFFAPAVAVLAVGGVKLWRERS